MTPTLPLIYAAISPELADQIQLEDALRRLEGQAQIERWAGPGSPPPDVLRQALRTASVLVTGWGTPSLIDLPLTGSAVRLVAHTAGSVKHLLAVEQLAAGLRVSSANESLAEAVAEFTIGAILAMRRQMFLCAARYKAGQFAQPYTAFHELSGSTVGIIGASAIGRRVMELLRPWHVKLLVYDPYCPPALLGAYQAEAVGLLELFQRSDIVSLHAPVTPETTGMLRSEHFRALKDGALFVNTARGRLVDADALLRELQTGRISALLDVTDPLEPLPLDSPFFQLENCVLLPHIAGHSAEARRRQGQYAAEDIQNFLAGRPLRFEVLPERWATNA